MSHKDLEEEYKKEEDIQEHKYVKMFPKSHSSLLPRARLDVKLPDTMEFMGGFDSIRMTIPHSYNYKTNFNSGLFGKKRKEE